MVSEALKKTAKSEAFEFRVDYKPFQTDLNYREYAEYGFEKGFIAGSIHQAEKMYSEEEVRAMIEKALTHNNYEFCGSLVTAQGEIRTANFGIWFEENKKK